MTEFKYETSDLEAMDGLKNYYEWILDEIRPFFGNRVAEIGAGIGTFTDVLVRDHLQCNSQSRVEAFEPASNLYHRLEVNLHTKYSDLLRANRLVMVKGYFKCRRAEFDTIIMINVLEHISDDREATRVVHNSLAAGGTFVVFVPALPWLFSSFDKTVGHQRRYTKEQLRQLFIMSGFEVIKARYMDCLGVLPWYCLYVLGRSQTISPSLARFYDKYLIPVIRWIERLWEPCIGKNIIMVGQTKVLTSQQGPVPGS